MIAWQDFLGSKPGVRGGEICATGTRIPVTVILDNLAEGSTREEILRSYPSLRAEHLDAALAYAAELAHEERLVPLRAKWISRLTRVFRRNSLTICANSGTTPIRSLARDFVEPKTRQSVDVLHWLERGYY